MLAGLGVIVLCAAIGGLVTTLPDPHTGEPAPLVVGAIVGVFGLVLGGLVVVMGSLGVVVGLALRKGRQWAMFAACALGFMQMANLLGMALAVWTFVVVIQELTRPPAPS